jgi:hypothetical protein
MSVDFEFEFDLLAGLDTIELAVSLSLNPAPTISKHAAFRLLEVLGEDGFDWGLELFENPYLAGVELIGESGGCRLEIGGESVADVVIWSEKKGARKRDGKCEGEGELVVTLVKAILE